MLLQMRHPVGNVPGKRGAAVISEARDVLCRSPPVQPQERSSGLHSGERIVAERHARSHSREKTNHPARVFHRRVRKAAKVHEADEEGRVVSHRQEVPVGMDGAGEPGQTDLRGRESAEPGHVVWVQVSRK